MSAERIVGMTWQKRRAAALAALLWFDSIRSATRDPYMCSLLRRAERADHVPVGEMAIEFAGNTSWVYRFLLH